MGSLFRVVARFSRLTDYFIFVDFMVNVMRHYMCIDDR